MLIFAPKYAPITIPSAISAAEEQVDVSVAVLLDPPQQPDRRNQCGERRADGLQFLHLDEEEQRRHDDQSSADAKHPGQNACDRANNKQRKVSHSESVTTSQTNIQHPRSNIRLPGWNIIRKRRRFD